MTQEFPRKGGRPFTAGTCISTGYCSVAVAKAVHATVEVDVFRGSQPGTRLGGWSKEETEDTKLKSTPVQALWTGWLIVEERRSKENKEDQLRHEQGPRTGQGLTKRHLERVWSASRRSVDVCRVLVGVDVGGWWPWRGRKTLSGTRRGGKQRANRVMSGAPWPLTGTNGR